MLLRTISGRGAVHFPRLTVWPVALAFLLLTPFPAEAGIPKKVNVRASMASGGPEPNNMCTDQAISSDGKQVVFSSWATNLVAGDSNAKSDIFVYVTKREEIERVSIGPGGVQANDSSFHPSISSNGRFVAFESDAGNLVTGDSNAASDIFVYDRRDDTMERVSVGPGGVQSNSFSYNPVLSGDGRFVAYSSDATNLVVGDTNSETDIFVFDRKKGTTERVSVGPGGAQGFGYSYAPSISNDGRHVAFASFSDNLVAGDTNTSRDVFVHDRKKHKTKRVSVSNAGVQGADDSFMPSISGNGRYVAFHSWAENLVASDSNGVGDIFLHDRKKHKTKRISLKAGGQPAADSENPSISKSGRYVAFTSWDQLLPFDTNNDEDVYLFDTKKSKTRLISVPNPPMQSVPVDANATLPAISPEGRHVTFSSVCSYVVQGDTNGFEDVFLRRW